MIFGLHKMPKYIVLLLTVQLFPTYHPTEILSRGVLQCDNVKYFPTFEVVFPEFNPVSSNQIWACDKTKDFLNLVIVIVIV